MWRSLSVKPPHLGAPVRVQTFGLPTPQLPDSKFSKKLSTPYTWVYLVQRAHMRG